MQTVGGFPAADRLHKRNASLYVKMLRGESRALTGSKMTTAQLQMVLPLLPHLRPPVRATVKHGKPNALVLSS